MNEKKNTHMAEKPWERSVGFLFSLSSAALILAWLGVFKFTMVEAEAIYPLLLHHPLTAWLYGMFSITAVSRMVGIVELGLALLLLLSVWKSSLTRYAAFGMMAVFAVTLSFLFTTPDMWRTTEHIPSTDFFILKDLMLLGFGIMLLEASRTTHQDHPHE